jgi:hypothetical protein
MNMLGLSSNVRIAHTRYSILLKIIQFAPLTALTCSAYNIST